MKSKFLVILVMIISIVLLYACSETGLEYGKDNINNGSNSNNGSNNNSNNNNGANNGNNSNNNDSNNNNSGSGGSNNEGGSSNGGGNSNNGGSQVELSFDEKYPNMKVGVHSFNEIDGKISEEERLEVAKKFAVIRTLFNTKEFINVIKENYADFNSRDEGKQQTIKIVIPPPAHRPDKPAKEFIYEGILGIEEGDTTDNIPDGGCWIINTNFPQVKPCGSYLGFNQDTKIVYFLSERDQTNQEYKNYKYYNAPFAKRKYRDLLDMDRMLEIFARVEYNVRVGKQNMTGYDRAELGPYRYLMDLDDPSIKVPRFVNMPNHNWMNGVGGGVAAVLMHGIMHNLGFTHYADTNDFGKNISPVSAISQYIKYEGPKLENAQAPYNTPEIRARFQEIKDEYIKRYSKL